MKIDPQAITELSLVSLRTMPEEKAATLLDYRLRALEDTYKRSFIEKGVVMLEIQERQLWRWLADENGLQFHSFESYVSNAAPQSRRDCFYAMKAVKELQDIPMHELKEIPRCNIALLQSISTGVRSQPEVIEAAKSLPEKEFLASVMKSHPDQHLEGKKTVVLPKGDAEEFEKAIEMAMAIEGCTTRAEAIRAISVSYIQDHASEMEHMEEATA